MAYFEQIHESFIIFYAPSKQCFQQDFQAIGLFPGLLENPSFLQHARKHFSASMDSPRMRQTEVGEYKKNVRSKAHKAAQHLLVSMKPFRTMNICNWISEALDKLFYWLEGSDEIWGIVIGVRVHHAPVSA